MGRFVSIFNTFLGRDAQTHTHTHTDTHRHTHTHTHTQTDTHAHTEQHMIAVEMVRVALMVAVMLCTSLIAATPPPLNHTPTFQETNDMITPFIFIKTHKTGSSTLAVLLGHALERRKLFPAFGEWKEPCFTCLGWPRSFTNPSKQLTGADPTNFAAVLEHMIFSEATYSTLQGLLGQDVPTFSIVREPVARFISSMRFFGITGLERHGISLLNLNDASVNKLLDLLEDRQYVNKMRENQRLHSILSYPSDFGITKDPFIDRDEFDKKFRKAQSRVGVVVLTEDWFLSMAMLRQYLHIPLEDLVWNNLKRAKRQPLQLSDETTARIRRLLWKDVRIYEHYKQQFYDQVTPTMRAEAEVIKKNQLEYEKHCDHSPSRCLPVEDDFPFLKRRRREKRELYQGS